MDYKDYNDFELLNYIAEESEEANNILFKKYEPLIKTKAKKFEKYIVGTSFDINDLIQEGMIGLNQAIQNYNESKETLFYTYADICIERRLVTFVISAKRKKHSILNDSISYDIIDENGDYTSFESVFSDNESPESILLTDEFIKELKDKANDILTDFEINVFNLKIAGFEYTEIADILGKDRKSIDNAIQRIKKKLEK